MIKLEEKNGKGCERNSAEKRADLMNQNIYKLTMSDSPPRSMSTSGQHLVFQEK